ncbi:hypothetical protein PAXRUDRAFT_7889 [Paxillus rubicundulus Ve08.2h10]|uniref:Uncharacterized protein n=1 Tax=Paxillus rubicundulus Ve08.2h10 TaxID=930991 RepID=A0A0D0EB11_9AGAM|nr:hypothetical protein PAXRUDRAFT_7889 [Paxillus rubicundulus Ve08.2h10]
MSAFTLSTLVAQFEPAMPVKLAEQVAFEAATACFHALMLSLPGDMDNMAEEWDVWSDKQHRAMNVMDVANQGALSKGLKLKLPAGIIPNICKANVQVHMWSLIVEDLAPMVAMGSTPVPLVLPRDGSWKGEEVVLSRLGSQ